MAILAFQRPDKVIMVNSDDRNGVFEFRPLEPGYGITIGNSLRRILLSSLEGFAVTSVRISGVDHEFSTIKGVVEDVTEIILNLKRLRVKLLSDEDATLRIDVSGEGEVRAEHIEQNPAVKILNPDLHIATLSKNGNLTVELRVSDGRGYVSAEELKREDDPRLMLPSLAIAKANAVIGMHVGGRTLFRNHSQVMNQPRRQLFGP